MRSLLVAVLLVVTACKPTLPPYAYAKEPDPRNKELVLGVGDVIGINVWDNAPFNTEATIRPDGTITMPLIGDLKAVGETPSTLRATIGTRIANFVKLQGQGTDQITVAVRQWRSYRFTIAGEVARTGVFTSDTYVTVAEAIAMAGGLSRFAKRGEIRLLRTDTRTGKQRSIPLDYDMLASGARLDMNIFVLPGDSIYVP
ncbi:MAG: polysaccharide biosynthesis/export family protein [Proteobacteria bacterium]|nr:polysaccharide biosynthesis/export family protein [Pseudomonadota bacterium]